MEAWVARTSEFYRVIIASVIYIVVFVEEHFHLINSSVQKSSYTAVCVMVLTDFVDKILFINIVQIKGC